MNGLVVRGTLGVEDGMKGWTVLVRDGAGFAQGYEIAGVKEEGDRKILLLGDDPGFEMDGDGGSRQCFFPGRTWTGENRFEVANVVTRQFE